MDILTSATQSYQTNQRLSDSLKATEEAAALTKTDAEITLTDDAISLSSQREIYDWVAQAYPNALDSADNIHRLNQTLHDYQIFSLADINTVNQLITHQDEFNLLGSIQAAHENSQSFAQSKQLEHLTQVYSTILAAKNHLAA